MKAIDIQPDNDRTLLWAEMPDPTIGAEEVLIRACATAVNRADLLQRSGRYPVPPGASEILGLEVAGEIVNVGRNVNRWSVGQRVCALLPGGGYAEAVAAHQDVLLEIPDRLSFEEAASLPEVLYTAYLNLFMEGRLQGGERALIHAGGSGVGTMAIQLCRAFDAPVYATSSAGKLAGLRTLGADAAIDREAEDFVLRVSALTEERGVDVILDPVGGAYLERNLKALARGGRLVLIGLLGGARAELPMDRLLINRQRIIGSVLRSRSIAEKGAITAEIAERVWPLIAAGEIQPVIDRVLPITEANSAHALLKSNQTFGKIVLRIEPVPG